jgi:AraC-like DNA-binding protein
MLLMTAALSSMLALLLFSHVSEKRMSNYLLGSFLLLYAIIPVDKLVTYSSAFKLFVLSISPNLFIIGGSALLLEGPVLYLYAKSVAKKNFQLRRYDSLHLIPFFLYLIYAYFMYFQFDAEAKYELATTLKVFEHWTFKYFFAGRDTIRIIYGILSLMVIIRYRQEIRQQFSEIQKIDMQWLMFVVIGFLSLRCWMLLESLYSVSFVLIHGDKTDLYVFLMSASGLYSGYFTFFLIVMLIFFSLRYSLLLEGIDYLPQRDSRSIFIGNDLIEKTISLMEQEKPHLTHNITIDALASRLRITPKTLSVMLNKHFEKNFFEFINYYRIQEAKTMLASPEYKNVPIIDILSESGFSSKSAFNNFFKRVVGMEPREYRKQQAAQNTNETRGPDTD